MLAIVYPKISSFFGFLGGFFGCLLVVAIPLGIHMKLSENRWSAINILRLIFSTCIITLGFGGAIIS